MGRPVLNPIPQSDCKSKFQFNSNFLSKCGLNHANLHFGIFVQCIIYFIFLKPLFVHNSFSEKELNRLQKEKTCYDSSQLDNLFYRFQYSCLILILQKINVRYHSQCLACYNFIKAAYFMSSTPYLHFWFKI